MPMAAAAARAYGVASCHSSRRPRLPVVCVCCRGDDAHWREESCRCHRPQPVSHASGGGRGPRDGEREEPTDSSS
uniref:Uncharacterized protein n=1 Tax=Oryza meridionalis TaxID=40149 RepID=A0A0E0C5M4_9ORYZ